MKENELYCTARFKVHLGKPDEYKRLSALCMESARSKDTGTLEYHVFRRLLHGRNLRHPQPGPREGHGR